jgi:hypothetical protein
MTEKYLIHNVSGTSPTPSACIKKKVCHFGALACSMVGSQRGKGKASIAAMDSQTSPILRCHLPDISHTITTYPILVRVTGCRGENCLNRRSYQHGQLLDEIMTSFTLRRDFSLSVAKNNHYYDLIYNKLH